MEESAVPPLLPPAPDSWRENVAAVVLDAAGRVLLGLGTGHNAYWHFPQGGLGARETHEDALRRELWEEARLAPEDYRIIACYGGLRYRYRKSNDKSARWRGQEQTYVLVLCSQEMPHTDCSHTDEFCALTWVPWSELSVDLFAPVKRKVVAKVLETFFPPHLHRDELVAWLQAHLTPRRYRLAGRPLEECPAGDRSLYGGGKEEMMQTLGRLSLRLRALHKAAVASGRRLLVLLHGAEDSGRKQCLRRLSASLDPLHLFVTETSVFCTGLPWGVLRALPSTGGISLVLHRETPSDSPQDWLACESWLRAQGFAILKVYLHAQGDTKAADLLACSDSEPSPWYIVPSEKRWYRDYVVASLVASRLSE